MHPNDTASPHTVKHDNRHIGEYVELWRHWSRQLPTDRRPRWSFVYLASKTFRVQRFIDGRLIRFPDEDHTDWKIGVSKHPWKRRSEISANSIEFSRFVHLPYHLEQGLHDRYAAARISPWEEWFRLTPEMVGDAMRVIDFWQLMNPHDEPSDSARIANPETGVLEIVTEFDSHDERLRRAVRWL